MGSLITLTQSQVLVSETEVFSLSSSQPLRTFRSNKQTLFPVLECLPAGPEC